MWPLSFTQCTMICIVDTSILWLCVRQLLRKENGKRSRNEWYFFDENFYERRQKDDAETEMCLVTKRNKSQPHHLFRCKGKRNEDRCALKWAAANDCKGKRIILLMCELFTNYGVCCTPVHVLWFFFCNYIIEMSWFPKLTSLFTNAHSLGTVGTDHPESEQEWNANTNHAQSMEMFRALATNWLGFNQRTTDKREANR